jgi:hypothetical protein
MAENGFRGSIPSLFGNMSSIGYLDLAYNCLEQYQNSQLTSSLLFLKLSNIDCPLVLPI